MKSLSRLHHREQASYHPLDPSVLNIQESAVATVASKYVCTCKCIGCVVLLIVDTAHSTQVYFTRRILVACTIQGRVQVGLRVLFKGILWHLMGL